MGNRRSIGIFLCGVGTALVVGCATKAPIPAYPPSSQPARRAIVIEDDNLTIITANGFTPRNHFALFGKQAYEVAAGKCMLLVQYDEGSNIGKPIRFTFDAVPGRRYRLNSYVHGGIFGNRWQARLIDEETKQFVPVRPGMK